MARIICLFVLIFFSFSVLGDETFEAYKRRLKHAHAKVSASCPQQYRDKLAQFARAIRHHDAAFVRRFVDQADEYLLALAIRGPYDFPKREQLKSVSALQLAVFAQDRVVVRALLNVSAQKPYLIHSDVLTSAFHMAAYLDDAEVVREFLAFIKQNPSFSLVLGADNPFKATPLATALKYQRYQAARALALAILGPTFGLLVDNFVRYSRLVESKD